MRNKKLWIFNATNSFVGNPKWLFIYVNKYRKDINAYWMCDDSKVIDHIRSLGYKAELYSSKKAEGIKKKAGVFVVHQAKEHFPVKFKDEVVVLNLWHGVGIKPIERYVDSQGIKYRTYKKYIRYNQMYRNNQLFLTTSPMMEKHFKTMLNLDDDQILRSGYPSNMFDKNQFSSYDHNIKKRKKLDANVKVALYAPTFRDYAMSDFFGNAIPDVDRLLGILEENNILLIIKMHYLVTNDVQYKAAKEQYGNHSNILFWDDNEDIYEVFNQIDIGIVDYSSIYYDLLSSGVNKFIRYIYDYDDYLASRELVYDYQEMTTGEIVKDFDGLLNVLSRIEDIPIDSEKNDKIRSLFWEYDTPDENGFEKIINSTLSFGIKNKQLPKLYSFDIFDTIIQRKTLKPEGIFFYVKDRLLRMNTGIPFYVIQNYPRVRTQAENYVRDFYKKSEFIRDETRIEIRFIDVINRIKKIHELTDEQAQILYDLEIEAEINNIEGKRDKLEILYDLLDKYQNVILISDMYLPKEVIQKMLDQVDSRLTELPLFLSSEIGDQKSTSLLYLDVFEKLNYDYSEWIHYGDNKHADLNVPKKLHINAIHHNINDFNFYEKHIIGRNKNYDTYLVATILARFREDNKSRMGYYVYSYISSYFVPYVNWSIKKAIYEKIDTLYFISRDGELLKKIADAIIEFKGYNIKTKYIYGSRKAWRIPSFINEVDEEFFSPFGNFTGLIDFKSALAALNLNENEFDELFPKLSFIKNVKKYDKKTKELIRLSAKNNQRYIDLLLKKAAEERQIVNQYLNQEIDFNEKFAFVEYWGRGYTQDCLDRLINNITEEKIDTIFFYARSIYPTVGTSVRYNYTSKMTSLIFIESIFANIPYESVPGYKNHNGIIKPIINFKHYNKRLYDTMDEVLPKFVEDFYGLPFIDEDEAERNLYDFGVDYFKNKPEDPYIVEFFAPLKDSVILYEPEVEYAPPITYRMASKKLLGKKVPLKTKNKRMSIKRSPKGIQKAYDIHTKHIKGKLRKIKQSRVYRIMKRK